MDHHNIREANLLQAVINAVPVPIFFKDAEGLYLGCNAAFEEYVGLSKDELVGKSVFELFAPDLARIYYEADKALYDQQGMQKYEAQVTYADGSVRDVMFHKAHFFAETENISGLVGAILDITERKRVERELEKRALTDSLTGLDNRASLLKDLDHAIKLAKRSQRSIAFMMLDIDDFKRVNDTFGHPTGDALLVEAGNRLKASVRESDLVARLGGDEFAVVLEDSVDGEETIIPVAEKIIKSFDTPFYVDGHELQVGVSVGIACTPLDGENTLELMKIADIALYRVKAQNKGKYQFFSHPL